MNRLSRDKRKMILSMLVEGSSMRSTARTVDVSINTVVKLMRDSGQVAADYHDARVRSVTAQRVQCDEIWSFCYAKQRNVGTAKAAPSGAGDVWTWTALDSDTKLMIAYTVGGRDADVAFAFIEDLRSRLANRVQLTTDGWGAYQPAVGYEFGADGVDYAMLVKIYGEPDQEDQRRYSPAKCLAVEQRQVYGDPDPAAISTSHVERHNLSMRMGMRRFTRLTNAFSKKVENHYLMVALYMLHYNWVRVHSSLRVTPAMEAGLTDTLHDMDWIVDLVDAAEPPPRRPDTYRKRLRS